MSRRNQKKRKTEIAKRDDSPERTGKTIKMPSAPGSQQITQTRYEEHYSGPLPHPNILAQYDNLAPGCAAQIIDQFVEQSKHRRSLEAKVIDHEISQSSKGLYAGLLIAIIGLVGGLYVVSQGYEIAGLTTVIAAVGGLAGLFVFVQNSRKEERLKKMEISSGGN